MLLQNLRSYLQMHQQAKLTDIAQYLNVPPSVAESLIKHWLRKGHIQVANQSLCGSSCQSCHCETYVWIEHPAQDD